MAAQATPVLTGSEASLQSIVNGMHTAGGAPDVNAGQWSNDQLWQFGPSGQLSVTLYSEISANAGINAFGIYDAVSARLIPLFNGQANSADSTTVNLFGDGSLKVTYTDVGGSGSFVQNYVANTFSGNQFGFYLSAGSGVFFSQQARNTGSSDQMVAFRGDGDLIQLPGGSPMAWSASSYLLAWEDLLYGQSDKDFNDMVVFVDGVTNVTSIDEPITLGLFGLGLLGLASVRLRGHSRSGRSNSASGRRRRGEGSA
jgi:hypothetical protein